MNIDRRQLALPALALGLLGMVPALISPAFITQFGPAPMKIRWPRMLSLPQGPDRGQCRGARLAVRQRTQLQPLRRPRRGQGDLHRQRHQWKVESAVAGISGHKNRRGRSGRDRALPLGGRSRSRCRRQEELNQSAHPDELAEAGCGLETAVAGIDQALTADRGSAEAVLPAVTPPSAVRCPQDGSRRARLRARCETPGLPADRSDACREELVTTGAADDDARGLRRNFDDERIRHFLAFGPRLD